MVANAHDLGVADDRIMIGGASAGGGLAAGTALRARDAGGPTFVGELLIYPMLDHRNDTSSSHAIQDARVWNRAANVTAWEASLGGGEPAAYSSPSRSADLSGLPPALISVGAYDMFLDEDIAYARELDRAGVDCELHVFPGAFHGSVTLLADHPTSVRWSRGQDEFIAGCLDRNG